MRKKLIEVSLPLEAINEASTRAKKKAPKGYPTSFHKYWAQRPLAACRAVIFAQLVDDPSAWPDRFPTKEAQDAERDRLHRVIKAFVGWPGSNSAERASWERALDAARWEIARSAAWGRGEEPPTRSDRAGVLEYIAQHVPPVCDPFCGAGSIPLEAQRLGLKAYGSDLNPLAVLISKALVEIPPKFAGLAPINPDSGDHELLSDPWRAARGLADDVRWYGRWMRDEARARIGHLYPDAALSTGKKATVIAWLWARTVRSPDPAARGAMVPLASSFVLSSKTGKETIVRVLRDASAKDGWRFEVQQGGVRADELREAKLGTKSAKAGSFVCSLTGSPIERSYIQREGKADRLGERLMAIVAEGDRGRLYLSPDDQHERVAQSAQATGIPQEARTSFLSGSTPTRAMITGGVCSAYGLRTWGHLFTDRQLVALTAFSDLVAEARGKALADARVAFAARGLARDDAALSDGGCGPQAYADAIATYLAFAVDRMAEYGSTGSSWLPKDNAIRSTFGRQALAMVWDFCEANYLAKSSAAIDTCTTVVADALERVPALGFGQIRQWAAQDNEFDSGTAFSTDPPYYDNIAYADLTDYFYPWLKRAAGPVWPSLFRRLQTPKEEELVATPYWHGGREAAETHFMAGMSKAMAAMSNANAHGIPLAIYYAYKQSEKSEDGVSSPGWTSFLQAVVSAGLMLDGTWPIRTENEERLIGNNANALASSVVLVCRPRPADARPIWEREFLAELRKEMPQALVRMRDDGLHPVDIPQAAIGPGMAVFSRYAIVRKPDDSAMNVGRAIALINQVRGEIDHADSGGLDAPTRFALDWFAAYGWNPHDSGKAIQLAQSYDQTERGLREAGVLVTERGEARLLRRTEMALDWRPSLDRTLTAWELAQALNRALNDGGGIAEAGALLAEARELTGDARWLADRLFGIAEDRRMTEEARGWGRLSESFDDIETAADRQPAAIAATTGELF